MHLHLLVLLAYTRLVVLVTCGEVIPARHAVHLSSSRPHQAVGATLRKPSILNQTCPNKYRTPSFLLGAYQNQFCFTEPGEIRPLRKARTASDISTPNILINSNSYSNTNRNNNHQPWDSKPLCLSISKRSPRKTYCIYTSSNFASNRGIALITTSTIADVIATSPAFNTKPPLLYPSATQPEQQNLYYESELPGRGKGLIANHTFHRGDLITSFPPVLVLDEETYDEFIDAEGFSFQNLAVEGLPGETREMFYGLAGVELGGDRARGIVRTNAFGARFGRRGEEVLHGIVVPEAAVSFLRGGFDLVWSCLFSCWCLSPYRALVAQGVANPTGSAAAFEPRLSPEVSPFILLSFSSLVFSRYSTCTHISESSKPPLFITPSF
jgi:hypothetical protein